MSSPNYPQQPPGQYPQGQQPVQPGQQWPPHEGQQSPAPWEQTAGGAPQQWGQQPPQPYGSQPPQAPQPYGSQPQHYGGTQGQPQVPYGSNPPPAGSHPVPPRSSHSIVDPHTGEIHPVEGLDSLQETDALLVVVSGPDAGAQILLDTDVVTVGRSPNADIFLDDVTVSRKHAEFVRTPSGFLLRDTGSLNGTYVQRQLIDSIELTNGADVQIGKFRMIFQQRPRSA